MCVQAQYHNFCRFYCLYNAVQLHFPTFYENCHNFRTHTYFHMKFGIFMSNYLLYNARKSEIKIYIFSRVIEILLGDFFFLTLYM